MDKKRKIAGWILALFIGGLLLMSGVFKFFDENLTNNFIRYQLEDWQTIIALGEIGSALLFIFPRTNLIGGLLLSAFFGGTILVHMSHGEPFFQQTALLIMVWVVIFLRHPHLSIINNK